MPVRCSIVYSDFLAHLDDILRNEDDPFLAKPYERVILAVGLARMVNKAGMVALPTLVDL